MLENFFKLNNHPKKIYKRKDFINTINSSDEINDIIYIHDLLKPKKNYQKIKIERKSFSNVSFSKTTLIDIEFSYCHFEDCLFIGTKLKNCSFMQCSFKNVNTHKIEIIKSYINPQSFVRNFKDNNISYSNIAVHLFQQLLNNSKDEEQFDFARIANFNFKVWQGRLSKNKYKNKKPYPINRYDYFKEIVPNLVYRFTFGYGLRLRNFLCTFVTTYLIFYIINLINWKKYKLQKKDFAIDSFDSVTYDLKANFYYTSDTMTQLVDSQFQPSSDFGMMMLTIQGFTGFILFSFLITILINRFVK